MEPELTPVRGRTGRGIDRGVVVLLGMIGVIGLALAKPWESGRPATPAQEAAIASLTPAASNTDLALGGASPVLSLELAREALAAAPRSRTKAWLTSAWRKEPTEVSYDATPAETSELGTECAGGAMFGDGTDTIGVTLASPTRPSQVSRVIFRRLFEGLPAVDLPVAWTVDDELTVALVSSETVVWEPGYYALTLDVRGRIGTVVFCIGRQTRLVDDSLGISVPGDADDAAARQQLLDRL